MSTGRLMLDVQGLALTDEEKQILRHPEVGGLILFTRNYQNKAQLAALIAEIRAQNPTILIAVDHEGGRVQRFREGFVRIPAMRKLAELWRVEPTQAEQLAEKTGWLMAAELVELDIDISFAPVLDVDWSRSEIIGDRAFGESAEQIISLTSQFMKGMHRAGMAATGKHFPGHGWVVADSHLDIPCDERSFAALCDVDLKPFQALIDEGLEAIMPAHVIYEQLDSKTAGFSSFWLKECLRKEMGFKGVIFSDDLSMQGATSVGGYEARTEAALEAGCDMVLVCNDPEGAKQVLNYLESIGSTPTVSVESMRRKPLSIDPQLFASTANEVALLLS